MGGGIDESVPGPPDADVDLKFEDLDASEQRSNNAETSEVQPQPQAEDTPHIERDHEGQELPAWSSMLCRVRPSTLALQCLPLQSRRAVRPGLEWAAGSSP